MYPYTVPSLQSMSRQRSKSSGRRTSNSVRRGSSKSGSGRRQLTHGDYVSEPGKDTLVRKGSARQLALQEFPPTYRHPVTGRRALSQQQQDTLTDTQKRGFAGSSNAGRYRSLNLEPQNFCGPAGGAASTSFPSHDWAHSQNALSRARFAPNPEGIIECAIRTQMDRGWIPVDVAQAKLMSYNVAENMKDSVQEALSYLRQLWKDGNLDEEAYENRVYYLENFVEEVKLARSVDDRRRAFREYQREVRPWLVEQQSRK